MLQSEVIIPIYSNLPTETYPSWLWPGSVIDNLYELSVELAHTFDWPGSTLDTLGRPRNEAAVRFVLTGAKPEVHPIDARWEQKGGGCLKPQWRVRLTIPPWLSEKEVLQAYRLMRGQLPRGTGLPKTPLPLRWHASCGRGRGKTATKDRLGPTYLSSGTINIRASGSRITATSASTACVAPKP